MNTLHLFKQDLRLLDNESLCYAASQGNVFVLYNLETEINDFSKIGSASKCWLHHSLKSLNKSLNDKLSLTCGDTITNVVDICKRYDIKLVCWNHCYEPWQIKINNSLKVSLLSLGITVKVFNGSLLLNPKDINKDDGTPFKVFTPFYKKSLLNNNNIRKLIPTPTNRNFLKIKDSKSLDSLNLLPEKNWGNKITSHWSISENAAHRKLAYFIKNSLSMYKEGRNMPSLKSTSYLSPYLHWGQISPHQIWLEINKLPEDKNTIHFKSELGWREFSYYQLYHNPSLQYQNLQSKFNKFPWVENLSNLRKWQQGLTGIPIVDAGMRELWQTGYMHNRVRMITASFLVKNLLIHWKYGEEWFRDCLFDADVANNSASWQWVAGCGADAAPYFRIFNPITQSLKFDSEANYIKKYVPELSNLTTPDIFTPWESSEKTLEVASISIGSTYPYPIVDLKKSRENALKAFQSLKR